MVSARVATSPVRPGRADPRLGILFLTRETSLRCSGLARAGRLPARCACVADTARELAKPGLLAAMSA